MGCWVLQLPTETPFAAEAEQGCLGCAQMCGLASQKFQYAICLERERERERGREREGERDSERPPTPSTPPFFFFSSSKTQSAQTLHGDCGRGLLISQQHRHVKEELEVIGLRSGIYSIRLCLKCSLSFFFSFFFSLCLWKEENKQGQASSRVGHMGRIPSVRRSWIAFSL